MGVRATASRLGSYRLSGIFALWCLIVYIYLHYTLNAGHFRIQSFWNVSKTAVLNFSADSNYLINTGVCYIPKTEFMPPALKPFWYTQLVPNCTYESILSDLDDETQILKLRPEFIGKNCCVQEVLPVAKHDDLYNLSNCERVTNQTKVHDKEILVTSCGNKLNLEANLLHREPVQKKLEFWNRYTGVKPYSVLLIGIDAFSRSHVLRSLPKSVEFMKSKMGFVDFKGYHSVAAGTIHNFMGFLFGKTVAEVRKTCQQNFGDPFEPCNFIWRNFSESNYVTMYIEDGDQTFNYGYQGGFRQRPTDYYIHPLFRALEKLRENISAPVVGPNYTERMHGFCTSSETVPQFLLRYTKRFTKKFLEVPSFSFTWLAYPFHDYKRSPLANFDNEMLKFFQFLNSSPTILRDTMIVFVNDHGDRGMVRSIDGFIERGLPPLFIRLPDRLEEQFPGRNFKKMLQLNSERLTSPYDIHHTFLHLLNLTDVLNLNRSSSDFEPSMPDRTSLILPVPLARTCETIHVYPTNCVCNVHSRTNTLSSPFILDNIRVTVGPALNKIIMDSQYKKDCAKWKLIELSWLLQAHILKNNTNQLEVLIQFQANPGKEQFETMVRVFADPENKISYGKAEVLGKFSRVSLYGNQSSCVEFKTDFDKYMKELCYCRSELKKTKS